MAGETARGAVCSLEEAAGSAGASAAGTGVRIEAGDGAGAVDAAPRAEAIAAEAEAGLGMTLGTLRTCAPPGALAAEKFFSMCGGRVPGKRVGSTGSVRGAV